MSNLININKFKVIFIRNVVLIYLMFAAPLLAQSNLSWAHLYSDFSSSVGNTASCRDLAVNPVNGDIASILDYAGPTVQGYDYNNNLFPLTLPPTVLGSTLNGSPAITFSSTTGSLSPFTQLASTLTVPSSRLTFRHFLFSNTNIFGSGFYALVTGQYKNLEPTPIQLVPQGTTIAQVGTSGGFILVYPAGSINPTPIQVATGNSANDFRITGVSQVSFDQVLVSGTFTGTYDFNPSLPGTTVRTSTGLKDGFLSLINLSNGNLIWNKQFNSVGTPINLIVHKAVYDIASTTITALLRADFSGALININNIGVINPSTAQGAGLILASFDLAGNFLLAKPVYVQGGSITENFEMVSDNAGSFYFSANTPASGTVKTLVLDPALATASFTLSNAAQTFVAKYDFLLNNQWGNVFNGISGGFDLLSNSNIYFAATVPSSGTTSIYNINAFTGAVITTSNFSTGSFQAKELKFTQGSNFAIQLNNTTLSGAVPSCLVASLN